MTDDVADGAPAPVSFDTNDWLARERDRARRLAELRPGNKTALFDALAGAGIVTVEVQFDGVGDSGQIEGAMAFNDAREIALPAVDIAHRQLASDSVSVSEATMPVFEVIETLVYELFEEAQPGWEINAGSFGTFTFDVAARTIRLEHHERFEDTLDTTHEF